jgi:N-acetylglucosamine kinase-like BadF-type ATPase
MNTYTLIADSGSTKTDWALATFRATTQGISPIHQSEDTILAILQHELLPQLGEAQVAPADVLSVEFYGSGVLPHLESKLERLLSTVFPHARSIQARSDMLGAARALCGHHEGLACILGTGANSCLYDGQDIVQNTPPMGYILGDEGSGAVLGRMLLNAIYKERLFDGARELFERAYSLSMSDVIERVYRQPMANRWLASLAPFAHQHLDKPEVSNLVVQNFRSFISHNLVPYHRPDLPIAAVGSIAYYFQEQLRQAATLEGCSLGRILRSPIEALAQR